jgi:hypothetical protein
MSLNFSETNSSVLDNSDLKESLSDVPKGKLETSEQEYEVFLEKGDDPKNLHVARKWIAVLVISAGSMCVTCVSSMAAFVEEPVAAEFNVPSEVTVLGVSLFVIGFGSGNLFVRVVFARCRFILSFVSYVDGTRFRSLWFGHYFMSFLVSSFKVCTGRNLLYQTSFFLFWVFSWPVAFAPNIGVFRILT